MTTHFKRQLMKSIQVLYFNTQQQLIDEMKAAPDNDFWTVEYPEVSFHSSEHGDIKDVPKNLGLLLNGRFSKNGQVWDCRVKKSNSELVIKLKVTAFNRNSDLIKTYVEW